MENYSIKDAFKALKDLDEKEVKLAYIPSLRESIAKDDSKQYLIESETFNINDNADMAQAKQMLDDNEDLERLEQVVDVDANVKDDLKAKYEGDCLLLCPDCRTIMYRSPDDLEKSDEVYTDENGIEQHFYNIGLACPHCGQKEDGFKLVGQVAAPDVETEQPEEEPQPLPNVPEEPLGQELNDVGTEEAPVEDSFETLPDDGTEEPVQENLKEDINPDQPCEDCVETGLSQVISDLVKDEWEAIDGYKSSIATFRNESTDPNILKLFDDIIEEEMKHVGQLEAALKTIAPEAENIEAGKEEGEQQLQSEEILNVADDKQVVVDEALTGQVEDSVEAIDDAAKALNINIKESNSEVDEKLQPAQFDFDKDEQVWAPSDDTRPATFDYDKDEDSTFADIDFDDIDEKSLDEQLAKYLKEQIETFESYTTTNATLNEDLGKLLVEGIVKECDGSETKAEFEFNVNDYDDKNKKLRFTEATENITLSTTINEKLLVVESLQ